MHRCKIHPYYTGEHRKPTSKKPDCTCQAVYEFANCFQGGKCDFCEKRFFSIKITYEDLVESQHLSFCSKKCYADWCKGV